MVCTLGVSAFWLADDYHVNPIWLFFAFNSIGFILVVVRKFHTHPKTFLFVGYFVLWLVVHGIVVVVLMGWVPFLYWLPIIGLELFVGYLAAYRLFGLPPEGRH